MAYEDISFRDKSNWKSKSYLILTHMPVEVWKLCDIYMWGHIVLWIDLLHNSQTVTKVIENLNVAWSSSIYIPFKVWSSTGSVNLRYTWESNGHAKDKSRHFVTKVYSKLQAFKFRLFRSFNLNIEILDIKDWRPKQYISNILRKAARLPSCLGICVMFVYRSRAQRPPITSPTKSCILLVLSQYQ